MTIIYGRCCLPRACPPLTSRFCNFSSVGCTFLWNLALASIYPGRFSACGHLFSWRPASLWSSIIFGWYRTRKVYSSCLPNPSSSDMFPWRTSRSSVQFSAVYFEKAVCLRRRLGREVSYLPWQCFWWVLLRIVWDCWRRIDACGDRWSASWGRGRYPQRFRSNSCFWSCF